jgi:NAD(P)-dependent dehydrogenase (short-subunit alcohol dehydrogenase family)
MMPKTLMCDPKLLKKDLSSRVYIVTGANSGSGFATVKQLAEQGATVVGACRRVNAGKEAFADVGNLKGSVDIMELDLASLSSVRRFVGAFLAKYNRLDGLVNNAGLAFVQSKTEDGFDTQFGVNHLGHFLLTELLLDTLKASAPSRIVNVSSVAHAGMQGVYGEIDFDDLHFDHKEFNPTQAYANSKFANVLYTVNLAQRLEGTSVSAFSVHPGWIRSNLAPAGPIRFLQNVVLRPFASMFGTMNWFEGAQTSLHCLLDDDAPHHSGAYYSQNSILYPNKENRPGGWPMKSPHPQGEDTELAAKLTEVSMALVGLK